MLKQRTCEDVQINIALIMAKLFLGIRIPNRTYERVPLENVDLEQNISIFREQISKKIEYPIEEIELLYGGNVLEDNEKMSKMCISPNTTVHVLKKTIKAQPYVSNTSYSDQDCQKIAEVFVEVTGTQINVQSRMNILQKILDEYPEFRKNLGAQALIRDSVLFNSLDKAEVIKKVAQNYSIICDAAEFIVKTTKKEITKNYTDSSVSGLAGEELFSDLTSGSEEETSGQSNAEQARIRRISRDQLIAALMQAGSASSNSLSNIAQRNTNLTDDFPTTSTSATLSAPLRITSSIFNNALSQALLSSSSTQTSSATRSASDSSEGMMDTSETQNIDQTTAPLRSYESELLTMREVGLTDDAINLQALILSNGDVEAAINFVYMWVT